MSRLAVRVALAMPVPFAASNGGPSVSGVLSEHSSSGFTAWKAVLRLPGDRYQNLSLPFFQLPTYRPAAYLPACFFSSPCSLVFFVAKKQNRELAITWFFDHGGPHVARPRTLPA